LSAPIHRVPGASARRGATRHHLGPGIGADLVVRPGTRADLVVRPGVGVDLVVRPGGGPGVSSSTPSGSGVGPVLVPGRAAALRPLPAPCSRPARTGVRRQLPFP
jgi:hypothetical protein